ncbi:NIF3-like protein 1 [Lutzomyia longipalpis]|uniref:NIF3-like protein 1 n=1 Tax=Lutzomyia longipalpis TaxID=7200 RepID=UPI00248469C1|nr:NIF3-like protein 1 [Lutzomyia longipalpis]
MWTLFRSTPKFALSGCKKQFSIIPPVQLRRMYSHQHPSLADVVERLQNFAPEKLAEPWDNVGLIIEPATPIPISRILLTIDLTENVFEEAVNTKSNLVISYHPPIFEGLKKITQDNWKGRIVAKCLEKGIAVYSPHTAWDSVRGGVNDWFGSFLSNGYDEGKPIIPNAEFPHCGAGRLYESRTPDSGMTLEQIIMELKEHIIIPDEHIPAALVHPLNQKIKSIALCAGSGASVLKNQKAEVYITGEMSHHAILDANHSGTSVILTHHTNSERNFLHDAVKILSDRLMGISVMSTASTDHDPLKLDSFYTEHTE